MRRLAPFLALLATCACGRLPETYPPPEQRAPVSESTAPVRASMMVNMNDDDAPSRFVRDIEPKLEGGTWRWTKQRPAVKILVVKTQNLKFVADFTIWEGTLKQTGPVTVSFYIGDKLLDSTRYDTPGYKHLEKPVNPEWLQTASDTVVSANIDKLYKDPADGVTLGFILTRIGFERQ